MIYKYLTLATILIANVSLALSQVTIGLSEKPVEGAILQLKNIPNIKDGSANSTKGLILPRVALVNETALILETDKISSTGLTVYNTTPYCTSKLVEMYPGIYTFDGDVWQPLLKNNNAPYANTEKVWVTKDQEGENFRASRFGSQIWMVDNLSAKGYDTESEAYGIITPSNTPKVPIGNTTKSAKQLDWCYPGPDFSIPDIGYDPTGLNDYFYKNNRSFGILYSWLYATGNSSAAASLDISSDQLKLSSQGGLLINQRMDPGTNTPGPQEVEVFQKAKTGKPYIQGICPNGWHIPSDREFTTLEKELFNHPEKYSAITQEEKQTWNPATWKNPLTNVNTVESPMMYISRGFYFYKEAPSSNYPQDTAGLIGNGNPALGNFNSLRCVYHGDGTYKEGMPSSWSDLF